MAFNHGAEAVTVAAKAVVELEKLEDEDDEDDSAELVETVEVADEVALEETSEPGCTSPQGGCCSTELGLYRIEN